MKRVKQGLFSRIKAKILYEIDKRHQAKNWKIVENSVAWRNVADIDQTLDMLVDKECSMCRFGDGEYKVMAGGGNGFQHQNVLLAKRLKQVLRSCGTPGLLVCIPNVFGDMELRTEDAGRFWRRFVGKHGKAWTKLLEPDGKYYNAHVTRLYMDYLKPELSERWYQRMKCIWKGKRILIVEGEKTKLGIGNDLLSGAVSIKRIICPSNSAFSSYDEIFAAVKTRWDGELVLIALGQTATVLAYDLHCAGIRALDVGHLDIEYEWFRSGVTEKKAIAGKFVKEVDDQVQGEEDPVFTGQIVARVGV